MRSVRAVIAGIDRDISIAPIGVYHTRGRCITTAIDINIAVAIYPSFKFIRANNCHGKIVLVTPEKASACIGSIQYGLVSLRT